nr:putative RNA-directed DNA polymerase, eukaryota, reverse transcriptase zinc-binding domain protein [Tanacetum cinerariifolium]
MHLLANMARFERSSAPSTRTPHSARPAAVITSFASIVKGVMPPPPSASPALLLDDTCVVTRDLGNFVMGEVKTFSSINNLHILLSNEGFLNVKVAYLGGFLDLEESKDDYFAQKRICIKTKQEDNILEKFKVIVNRKVFVIRAKELFAWSPSFAEVPEMGYCFEDDSVKGEGVKQMESCQQMNSKEESDNEVVSETYFGENTDKDGDNVADSIHHSAGKETLNDPFNIYDLLNKQKKDAKGNGSDSSIPFPSGFTPKQSIFNEVEQVKQSALNHSPSKSLGCSSRILENSQKADDHLIPVNLGKGHTHKEGWSILEVLEGMIKVGQTMGFYMEGVHKDMEKIIGSQGDQMETKMDNISDMEVKYLWGNMNFDFIFSDALGFSCGILCVWDHNMFCKEQHIISDNFVALYETWISNKVKILLILVYAPQVDSYKRILCTYLDLLIKRWNGESIVMGDFNEVRRVEERWGSSFNMGGAHVFNNFISNVGLIDLQLEAVCLDNHLSDHRPILLREKLQILKKEICVFVADHKKNNEGRINDIKVQLSDIDKKLDQGGASDDILLARTKCMNFLFESKEAAADLELPITRDEIRNAVWSCGKNKSPGPDGFSFEFFRKFWHVVGSDFCTAVEWFFDHASFPIGCNSSFIALIPKSLEPKAVGGFRPISLIGSVYKVITKILQSRLSLVILDLISNVQTTFLPNRQILDGPFIINELLARCHHKKQQAMVFKVDLLKPMTPFDGTTLKKFFALSDLAPNGIRGSVVVLTRQGDPLAPYLFILVMESLHLSISRVIDVGIFTGVRIAPSIMISHLFYADDAVFIGEWSQENLKGIMQMLRCFSLMSGLAINIKKSHLLGVGVPSHFVNEATDLLGCSVMKTPFKYLGITVGGSTFLVKTWDRTINKLKLRLSNWKLKTLSIGGRFTLIKYVLGSTPTYNMSLYKVPKTVLNAMESIRRNFFNGIQDGDKKILWIKWAKVLASKDHGGLGIQLFICMAAIPKRCLPIKTIQKKGSFIMICGYLTLRPRCGTRTLRTIWCY